MIAWLISLIISVIIFKIIFKFLFIGQVQEKVIDVITPYANEEEEKTVLKWMKVISLIICIIPGLNLIISILLLLIFFFARIGNKIF